MQSLVSGPPAPSTSSRSTGTYWVEISRLFGTLSALCSRTHACTAALLGSFCIPGASGSWKTAVAACWLAAWLAGCWTRELHFFFFYLKWVKTTYWKLAPAHFNLKKCQTQHCCQHLTIKSQLLVRLTSKLEVLLSLLNCLLCYFINLRNIIAAHHNFIFLNPQKL